ncbi:MAG: hypothetical protein JO227_14205, partial [Acetobacteraceae bacterium]|nr:hypothetical protein [Acetobacteraceae bacterium]
MSAANAEPGLNESNVPPPAAEAHSTELPSAGEPAGAQIRLLAMIAAARFHGAELDRSDLRCSSGEPPSAAALADWAHQSGLRAKAATLRWKQLVGLDLKCPMVLLLKNGSALLLVANDKKRDLIWIRHSR